jgi:hypothetical protein
MTLRLAARFFGHFEALTDGAGDAHALAGGGISRER